MLEVEMEHNLQYSPWRGTQISHMGTIKSE